MRALGRAGVAVLVVLAACGLLPRRGDRPNVFLLNVDMLRADHVGVYGYERDTTPVLDRLASEGVWFSAARSQAPWTYPSVVSLLTGIYPTSHGATYSAREDTYVTTTVSPRLDTLTTILHRAGYATAAFITNPLLKRSSGLDRGFDVFRDDFVGEWKRRSGGRWWTDGMTAERVHQGVLAWLDTQPRPPLFAYVHYIDVHGPYVHPKRFGRPAEPVSASAAERARITGRPRDLAVDLYDGELRHLDELIGRFLAALDERGILSRSIVIVTADHGEEFGEHGGHGHGHTLYEEMLRVPLIMVRTDAFPYTRRIDAPVAQIDVLPTLLDLLRIGPPATMPGQSLLPAIRGVARPKPRAILSEMNNRGRPVWNAKPGDPPVAYALFIPPSTKYVVGTDAPLDDASWRGISETLFDLAADPAERAGATGSAAGARGRLRRVLQQAHEAAVTPGTEAIDAETQDRLRVLGYLPDEAPAGADDATAPAGPPPGS